MTSLPTFAIIGSQVAIEGDDEPQWELTAYPSRMSCLGRNVEQAQKALLGMIHQAMEYEGDARAWHLRQFQKMSREQHALYVRTIAEAAGRADGLRLDECSPELAGHIKHHFAFYLEQQQQLVEA